MIKAFPFSAFPSKFNKHKPFKKLFILKNKNNDAFFQKYVAFNAIYPEQVQLLSLKQRTHLYIVLKATNFLAEPFVRVREIRNVLGKF